MSGKIHGKRKRSFELSQTFDVKRAATNTPSHSEASTEKARQRQQIKRIYESYLLLTSKTSNANVKAFEVLLSVIRGSFCEQRLASAFIPRCAAKFPDKIEAAVSSLVDLSITAANQENETPFADASCLSALQGLGTLCKAAAKAGQEEPISNAVEYLLRELSKSSRSDASRRMSDQDQPRLRNSDEKAASAASSLITIFKEVPQKVLAICMRGLQKGHGELYHGSKRFVSETLLRSSEGDTASITDSLGKFTSNATDVASSNCSIAGQVLQTMPNVQHWINETISILSKGSSVSKNAGEVVQMMTHLLQAVSPIAAGPKATPAVQLGVPVSPVMAAQDVHHRPSPLPSPFADHDDLQYRPGSISQATASLLEASGQNNPPGQFHQGRGTVIPPHIPPPHTNLKLEQLRPGRDVCLAGSILWLTGIPPGLPDAAIRAECSSYGSVVDVLQSTAPPHDEAFVAFADIRDAACCYEAMCDAPVWGPQRSNVKFCEDPSMTSGVDGVDGKVHVWVGGVGSSRGEEGVLRRLADECVPAPLSILRVAGNRPGLILQYITAEQGALAVRALDRDSPYQGQAPSAAPPPPPGRSSGGRCRTLWVGQVGPTVNEDKLISAFREYGMVTGWKFLRRSNCAFIDFDTPASATAALEALHGANFGGCQIRIEFKDERGNSMPSFGGRGPPPRRGRFPPAPHSPNHPGWLPPHRSLGPRACSSPIRRPPFARDDSPSWPPPPLQSRASMHPSMPAHTFHDRRGSMPGRSFVDQNSPARLDERGSNALQDRRARKASKWDVQGGPPDLSAQQQMPPSFLDPTANLQRRSSVEEGQISMPAETQATNSRPTTEAAVGARWRGMLAKSGSPVCEMTCSGLISSHGSASEPGGWPGSLDVTQRADLSYVLSNVSAMSALLRLMLAPQHDAEQQTRQRGMFIDFINNLSNRSRAGVVKGLPAIDESGPRTLYLVPPSVSVAERLKVVWDGKECIFAVVMPAALC